MAYDAHKNFAISSVATAPSPATSGTSLVVHTGDGALFSTPPFNCTVWPSGAQPTITNAEIVRVTNISTDTFTITRTQESTSARSIAIGDQIANSISVKVLTDVENNKVEKSGDTMTGSLNVEQTTGVSLSGNTVLVQRTVTGSNTTSDDYLRIDDSASTNTNNTANMLHIVGSSTVANNLFTGSYHVNAYLLRLDSVRPGVFAGSPFWIDYLGTIGSDDPNGNLYFNTGTRFTTADFGESFLNLAASLVVQGQQGLTLKTYSGGNGDVTIAPAGSGNINITPTTGQVNISAQVNMTATLPLFTTATGKLSLSQTGDTFGESGLLIQNRAGAAGAIFYNNGLDLVDFGFVPSSTTQSNIRWEHRSGSVNGGNTAGEFEFLTSGGSLWFYSGANTTAVVTGAFSTPKLNIPTGSNASAGTGTLSSGTATIATTAVTASSLIFLTNIGTSLTNVGSLQAPSSGITAGTSFIVNSTNVLDTSTFNWFIIN